MAYVLVRHTVADYATWKPLFDQDGEMRQKYSFKGGTLFHVVDRPNEVVILFEIEDPDQARTFMQSADLRETMQRGGVTGPPEVLFLEKIEQFAH